MVDLPIIVIGGGAIGLATAYHLAKQRAETVLVLEQNTLTSGTSWHAAGIVGPLRGNQNLTTLARYGLQLFTELAEETGQDTGYQQTGGYWLAQQQARLLELQRVAEIGAINNLRCQMMERSELAERLPWLQTDDLVGGLFVAEDAQINPVDLCMAYARGIRQRGGEIIENQPVMGFDWQDDRVIAVQCAEQRFACKGVVICAGLWSRQLAQKLGVKLPLQSVQHSYLISEVMTGLPVPTPILRDLDSGIYLKGDNGKLVLGAFEENARCWRPQGSPEDSAYIEFDTDWAHLEPMIHAGMHRVPGLQSLGVAKVINGPESFTHDTRQLMGRLGEWQNAFVAAGFNSIGIMSSAGVGKAMADWVCDGIAPMDLWQVDVQRVLPWEGERHFMSERVVESVHAQFAMHWPLHQPYTAREQKLSPYHQQELAAGAVMGVSGGWERAFYYAPKEQRSWQYSHGAQSWWPLVRQEADALQTCGALMDLSPFSKFVVHGSHACAFLQWVCSQHIDVPVGQVVYSLMLNHRGGIEAEVTLARLADERFHLISNAASRMKVLVWLRLRAKEFSQQTGYQQIFIEDITEKFAVIGVMGPQAWQCLADVLGTGWIADLAKYSSCAEFERLGKGGWLNRLSFVGEAGGELYVAWDKAAALMEELTIAAQPLGMGRSGLLCIDACRMEKGYAHWGHDIGSDETPDEAGLGFAVSPTKTAYGVTALREAQSKPMQRRRVLLKVDAAAPLSLHDEPIYLGEQLLGVTTSGALAFRSGMALSQGYVTLDAGRDYEALLQQTLTLHVGHQRLACQILSRAAYDPQNYLLSAPITIEAK